MSIDHLKKTAKTVGMSTHFVQNLNCRFPEIYGLIFVGIPQIALFPASTISDRRPKKVFQHCNWFCNSYIFIKHWYKTYAWTSCTQISLFMQGPNLYRLFLTAFFSQLKINLSTNLQHLKNTLYKICKYVFLIAVQNAAVPFVNVNTYMQLTNWHDCWLKTKKIETI